jgi:aminoglycoside 6-adenylyltransferase
MRDEKEMMNQIIGFAKNDPRVKAVCSMVQELILLPSKDRYQDFDVVYVVEEIESWLTDIRWIDVFGQRDHASNA